jgi:hypothetical protein
MSAAGKRRTVKEHYLGLVRDGLKRQKMSDADINTLLKKPFKGHHARVDGVQERHRRGDPR